MFREILEPIYQELLLTSTFQDRYVIIIRIYIMHEVKCNFLAFLSTLNENLNLVNMDWR